MFCTNTKIVVIGTSVTRKAGPRIGSLGYISAINNARQYNHAKTYYFQIAKIIFIRYGYEKRKRFEEINVNVISPKTYIGNNKRKCLNRCIRDTKGIKFNFPNICISPIEENLVDDYELSAKIISKLRTKDFTTLINLLLDHHRDKSYCASVGIHNIKNIYNVITPSVSKFLLEYNETRNIHNLKRLVLKYYKNNAKSMKELFVFINTCVVLSDRVSNKRDNGPNPWYNPTFDNVNLTNNLFNIFEFNRKINPSSKYKEVIKHYKELSEEIKRKGNVVINKH